MRRRRKRAVGLEQRFTRTQEALAPFATRAIVLHPAEQPDAVQRPRRARADPRYLTAVERVDLGARKDRTEKPLQQSFEIDVAEEWANLGQVFLRDLGRGAMHGILQPVLMAALVGAQSREPLADRHQVARAQERVPAEELERVLLLAGERVGHGAAAEESLQRMIVYPCWK